MTLPARKASMLICLLLTPMAALAQSDSLSTIFQQELDTRTLTLQGVQLMQSGGNRFNATAYSRITERSLPLFEPQWKTDFRLSANGVRNLSQNLDLILTTSGEEFRDRQARMIVDRTGGQPNLPENALWREPTMRAITGQNSRISRGQMLLGARYQYRPGTDVTLQAGAAFDQQEQGSGSGLSALGDAHWVDPTTGSTSLNAAGEYSHYGERTYHESAVRASSSSEFGDASNRLTAGWSYRRNDLYLGTSSTVVSRIHDELRIDNRLSTPLDHGFNGVYDFGIRRTKVDYSGGGLGQSLESDLTNRLAVQGIIRGWRSELSYNYNVEDREYTGDLILGRRQMLMLTARRTGAAGDRLAFHYSTQKLVFDSPDSLERSDRDRLIHRFSVQATQPLNDYTDLTFEALTLLDHLVYLEAQRSSDNRWNRVLRLKPGIRWNPAPGWQQRATFELLANYTAYDFDVFDGNGDIRSNALRRWSAADTLRMPLIAQLGGEVSARYDREDRGGLNWEAFSQEVSNELEALYIAAGVRRSLWDHLIFSAGYRYQRREEDRLSPSVTGESVRERARTYIAQGPFFHIETSAKSKLRLEIDATLLNVEDSDPNGRSRLDRITAALVHRW